jgi:hypothetical protein
MGPRNDYKDMLDNVVSPIICISMNHQNQLEQMTNETMFATNFLLQTLQDDCNHATEWMKELLKKAISNILSFWLAPTNQI